MSLFEPERVVDASRHIRAHEQGAFPSCVPQWVVDEHHQWMKLLTRGYDPDDPKSMRQYRIDHYGRHDREFIGLGAWRYVSDNRRSKGRRRTEDQPFANGMVRWSNLRNGFIRVTGGHQRRLLVAGPKDTH